MNNVDNFKLFVRKNPSFANYIKNGEMTWQKFYELYDMYGEDSNIWTSYKNELNDNDSNKKKSTSLTDVINLAKNIDVDKLQTGVDSLSKAVALFSDLFASKSSGSNSYKPRAIYRKFDD